MTALRDYQAAALDQARQQFAQGSRAVLVVGPTGMGKTVLFCTIAKAHVARGGRVLVVVHRRELLTQAVSRLQREGVADVGTILAGEPRHADASVQVASIGTLLNETELPAASLVVFDEAHHYVAAEWGRIAAHYQTAKIVGVTATPERSDGSPLGDIFDALVVAASVAELTELGHLVPCAVIAPHRRRRADALGVLEAYEQHAGKRPTVVFARSVKDARDLADSFVAAGVRAACVDGGTRANDRAARLAAFDAGDLDVLTNCFVLTEGWDCPRAEVCILARGCSSVGTYLQIVGRVLRPAPGKVEALLVDLRGVVHRHGLPDEERTFSLDGRAIGRGPTKSCPSCEADIPLAVTTCPLCGADVPVRGGTSAEEEKPEKLSRVDQKALERAFFLDALDQARLRGYKRGWIVHRFETRFGRKPWGLWREFFPRPAEAAASDADVDQRAAQ